MGRVVLHMGPGELRVGLGQGAQLCLNPLKVLCLGL